MSTTTRKMRAPVRLKALKDIPITCLHCRQEFQTRRLFNAHAKACVEQGAKLDAEMLMAIQHLMRDNGAEFFNTLLYSSGTYEKGRWEHLWRFVVLCAKRFGFTEECAHALYFLGSHMTEWNKRLEIYKASVSTWRELPPERRDYMYHYSLLELARTYCEQDFEHQLKEALEIASELMVLEANDRNLDKQDVPEIQQKAAEKLAALRKAGAA